MCDVPSSFLDGDGGKQTGSFRQFFHSSNEPNLPLNLDFPVILIVGHDWPSPPVGIQSYCVNKSHKSYISQLAVLQQR